MRGRGALCCPETDTAALQLQRTAVLQPAAHQATGTRRLHTHVHALARNTRVRALHRRGRTPRACQVVEGNPCIEYAEHIVFPWFGSFEVTRADANGGNVTYSDAGQLKADYAAGGLHPGGWHSQRGARVLAACMRFCTAGAAALHAAAVTAHPLHARTLRTRPRAAPAPPRRRRPEAGAGSRAQPHPGAGAGALCQQQGGGGAAQAGAQLQGHAVSRRLVSAALRMWRVWRRAGGRPLRRRVLAAGPCAVERVVCNC